MKEIFEEYGEFIIEAVAGGLFLGVAAYYLLSTPMISLINAFISSVLGGGA